MSKNRDHIVAVGSVESIEMGFTFVGPFTEAEAKQWILDNKCVRMITAHAILVRTPEGYAEEQEYEARRCRCGRIDCDC